jgi:hypothetical protein
MLNINIHIFFSNREYRENEYYKSLKYCIGGKISNFFQFTFQTGGIREKM